MTESHDESQFWNDAAFGYLAPRYWVDDYDAGYGRFKCPPPEPVITWKGPRTTTTALDYLEAARRLFDEAPQFRGVGFPVRYLVGISERQAAWSQGIYAAPGDCVQVFADDREYMVRMVEDTRVPLADQEISPRGLE